MSCFRKIADYSVGTSHPRFHSVHQKPVFSTERLWKCVAYTRKPFFVPHAHSVPEKALSGTERKDFYTTKCPLASKKPKVALRHLGATF